MHRRLSFGVIGVMACILSGSPIAKAEAATTSLVGGGEWAGLASISPYPCVFSCTLTFSGYFTGSITVLDGSGVPSYTATWTAGASPNLQTGTLTYNESCGSVPFAPPLTGEATGTVTLSRGTLNPASPSGSTVAQLTGDVNVARMAGAVLNITVSNVQLLDGGGVVLATAQNAGGSVGVFGVPVPTAGEIMANPLPPNCANEEAVTVLLSGTYAQPT